MTWKWGQSFTYTQLLYDDILSDISEKFLAFYFYIFLLFFLKFCLNLVRLDKWCLGGEDGYKFLCYFLAWSRQDQSDSNVAVRPLAWCTLFYCFPYLKSLIGDKWRDRKWSWFGERCNDCRSELARQSQRNGANSGSIDAPQSSRNKDGGKVVIRTAILVYNYV